MPDHDHKGPLDLEEDEEFIIVNYRLIKQKIDFEKL